MTEHAAVSIRFTAGATNPNLSLKDWFYLKKGREKCQFLTAYQRTRKLLFLP